MTPRLVVTAGPDKGRFFNLNAGETLQIGRSQATATRLADPTLSRVHCEIEWNGSRAVLINISSSGTLVNGHSVSQQELTAGDMIRMGSTEMRFELGAGAESSTVVPPATRPVVAVDLTSLVGQTLSHYAVEAVIAKGAAGVVFRAKDTNDGQTVAFKVLQPEYARHEEDMQRFIRGMKIALPLRHPNLVALHKAGKTGVYCWLAMEYVEGESMTQVIQRVGVAGMLDWRYGYRVAVHIARALEYAHGQPKPIIHRNVTPTNILFRTADKTVKLGDLVLAKALESSTAQQITRPGELVGDVAYMSPERTRGTGDIDGRADLYGLGATVYALIAGRPAFSAPTLPELITRIRNAEPEKPKKYQMAVPDLFQGVVMKLLAKRPEERFQSAKELLVDLDRVGKFAGVSA
ncbi:MAG TPA: FHA domain-containing serine/threonine-protein kinase [Gemmataceae bacterium]|nr:FHA domain-containing serine/threonine-protein kinase [Gemmataceae bacterium]